MDQRTGGLFSNADLARVRADHQLRPIRAAPCTGASSRPSTPCRAALHHAVEAAASQLLQASYSMLSERQLLERLDDDLLCR